MKDKLTAIINAKCDNEIKVELLEEFIRFCCEDYLSFSAERNDLIISALGLPGFIEDIQSVGRVEIFERFKEYQIDKHCK